MTKLRKTRTAASPETLAALAQVPRWTRAYAGAVLGVQKHRMSQLCRQYLDGARLLSDLDIAVLKGRPTKTGPKGPRGYRALPPTKADLQRQRAEAWGRIIDPTGALEHARATLDLQAARLEAERKGIEP